MNIAHDSICGSPSLTNELDLSSLARTQSCTSLSRVQSGGTAGPPNACTESLCINYIAMHKRKLEKRQPSLETKTGEPHGRMYLNPSQLSCQSSLKPGMQISHFCTDADQDADLLPGKVDLRP